MAAKNGDGIDKVELFERLTEVSGRAQQMLTEFWLHESGRRAAEPGGSALAFEQWTAIWADWGRVLAGADPARLMQLAGDYWTDTARLWSAVLEGKGEAMPPPAAVQDRRFVNEAWQSEPVYDLLRRSYLLASHYVSQWPQVLPGLSEAERQKVEFETRQFIDAMSPANFAALNPEVLQEARASNGESLLRGLANLLGDLERGKLTMTDESTFTLGVDIATTPGKVIFEGPLFQLIQYAPATRQVHETPLLFLPPWINKYYILDLAPEKSLVRWAVEQGFTVYMVSWAQGSATLADRGFSSYAIDGELKAIDLVLAASGARAVHVAGYCVAGSVLAATLSYMAATGQADKVASATFLTTQVDFTEAGDLLNFVTPPMLDAVEKLIGDKGYLDGRLLAASFNFLRPTELLWNYVVNNYLKGKENAPFDLLYWNSDPTNVPGRFMREYLIWLYRDNLLATPGGVEIGGVPIDLKQVRTPLYIQAGRSDHIAPAASCFRLTRAFAAEPRFVLAGSGHIAGVINPPTARKYGYRVIADADGMPATLEAFEARAAEREGSWWPDWADWLAQRSGAQVAPRQPGKASGFEAIEDAPGSYVRARIA